ncbi:MAG: ABC transporter permease [candidate division NC10 bacterium]|nr:ABC transporter permease [candidate division NC10 bacterium]
MYRKELEDHFSSTRSILLLTVILMVGLVTAYTVGSGLRKELEGMAKPSLVFLLLFTSTGAVFSLAQFIAFFGPLIGMVLGCDAINRERSARTLSKLLSQPIYRDAVINGKFLAGLTTIAIMLLAIVVLISGIGLLVLGVVPGWEEIGRMFVYLVVSVIYIGFWLALAILCSVLFRGMATSALATIALWIFFAFFMALVAKQAADVIAPIPSGASVSPARHPVQRGHGDRARSSAEDDAVPGADGPHGANVHQPLPEPAAADPERPDRCPALGLAAGHHGGVFRDLVRVLHAAGSPVHVTGDGKA